MVGTSDYTNDKIYQHSGKKALVLRGSMYGACVTFMAEMGFTMATSVEEADVVVFIGGADIDPSLYSEKPIVGVSGFDTERDIYEEAIYRKCVKLSKQMFGICRGAQFLHAMNGGSLWQDVNNHAGQPHWIVDIEKDVRVKATSLHHQMLQLNDKINIIAVCEDKIATQLKSENLFINLDKEGSNADPELEIEAGSYPETKSFFVQGHPEVGDVAYKAWTSQRLREAMAEPRSTEMQEQVDTINKKMKET